MILLAAPVSEYKSYVLFQWIEYIKKLNAPNGFKIVLADNSFSPAFSREIKKTGVTVFHRPPRTNEKRLNQVITSCNNILLDYFLQNKEFTHYFSLECDIFPPLNVLPRLLAHNKPVTAAMYHIGDSNNVKPMIQELTAAKTIQTMGLTGGFLLAGTGLQPVFSAGKGCLLIKREVFEQTNIKFRTEPSLSAHDDTFLAADLFKKNVPVFLDTSIICTHKNSDWSAINKKFTHKNNLL